ncbi:trichome birefringence-like [Striga asiatica]|uniref:Trichome birefringence-like n=1 Tax=Striga asiatica TaxID=4170 RepID=A0A5A7QQB4_STRAF|nr:trichome birefringence-like [Striga asiatica]
MKLHPSELRRKNPKFATIAAITFLLTIPLYFSFFANSSKKLPEKAPAATPSHGESKIRSKAQDLKCDLFTGEWVPNPKAPYYTNETCYAIQEHQNCMKFGRPDTGFMKWRWKPDGCELPGFDPNRFLELMKGKSLAFVGDSVARNHMQSLICLLSRNGGTLEASLLGFEGVWRVLKSKP